MLGPTLRCAGLTLYELLTLRPGFDSSDRLKLIELIKTEEPPAAPGHRFPYPAGPGDNRLEGDREGSQGAVPVGGGHRRGSQAVRRRRADPGPPGQRRGTLLAVGPGNPAIAVLGGALTALLVATSLGSMMAATYFRSLAGRESRANQQSQEAQKNAVNAQKAAVAAQNQAVVERDKSQRLSAGLAFEKGLALGEQGRADHGLLWMLDALETAPIAARGAGGIAPVSTRSMPPNFRNAAPAPESCAAHSPPSPPRCLCRCPWPVVRTSRQTDSGFVTRKTPASSAGYHLPESAPPPASCCRTES